MIATEHEDDKDKTEKVAETKVVEESSSSLERVPEAEDDDEEEAGS